jgi:hypothetical protein
MRIWKKNILKHYGENLIFSSLYICSQKKVKLKKKFEHQYRQNRENLSISP